MTTQVLTLADDIEQAAEGEEITHAVIGDMGWSGFNVDERHTAALARKGEVLSWAEARPLLDFAYDSGYGAPDCPAVYAYTRTWLLCIVQYDGSTGVYALPRNPTSGVPVMPGG